MIIKKKSSLLVFQEVEEDAFAFGMGEWEAKGK
jgi:hypothetical protein